MNKKKPATAGEKMVLDRVRKTLGPRTMPLQEFRTRAVLDHCRTEAKAHDRAIARAVRKERERCVWCARNFGATDAAVTAIQEGRLHP